MQSRAPCKTGSMAYLFFRPKTRIVAIFMDCLQMQYRAEHLVSFGSMKACTPHSRLMRIHNKTLRSDAVTPRMRFVFVSN